MNKDNGILEQLREAARRSGLSMLRLSEQSGLRYMSVHRFVAGRKGVTIDSAARLAEALGLEVVLRPRKPGKKA